MNIAWPRKGGAQDGVYRWSAGDETGRDWVTLIGFIFTCICAVVLVTLLSGRSVSKRNFTHAFPKIVHYIGCLVNIHRPFIVHAIRLIVFAPFSALLFSVKF